jgi:predicted metal-dependent enzyme (double-stranded beta helix superfamily)
MWKRRPPLLLPKPTQQGQPSKAKLSKERTIMFEIDGFLSDCIQAMEDNEPRLAVKEVLQRAMRHPEQVSRALPATRAELVPLHASERVSVLKVVWAPGMRFRPHNHLMWAAIGLYGGQEDNTFYRRSGEGIIESGGRELLTGDVALLGDDTIHAVANPRATFTGAIHVYGGNITARPGRSEWDDDNGEELDYDFERTRRYFESFEASTPR